MLVPLFLWPGGGLRCFPACLFQEFFLPMTMPKFWEGRPVHGRVHQILLRSFTNVAAWVKLSPFVAIADGLVTAWLLLHRPLAPRHPGGWPRITRILYRFLLNKWYFDELYDFLFVRPAKWLGSFLWKQGDVRTIDGYGPNGIAARAQDITGWVVRLQTGYLYHYAFVMLIGIAALVTWMMLGSAF